MVLPPTGLTSLLYAAAPTPEALFAVLEENGCLTRAARRDPGSVKSLMGVDVLARALGSSQFLSTRGLALAAGPPDDAPRSPAWRRRLAWGSAILLGILLLLVLMKI